MIDKQYKANQLGNMALFAVRYAIPRNTSADMAIMTALKSWWSDIPTTHRKQIEDTIKSEKGLYGNDAWIWNELLEWIEEQ